MSQTAGGATDEKRDAAKEQQAPYANAFNNTYWWVLRTD
jgi:hypothetical protein